MQIEKAKQTLRGPDGLIIELDAEQVFPEDPGQGTPVLVIQRNGRREYSATFNCVSDQGVLENTRGEFLVLSKPKLEWIETMSTFVDRWLTHWVREAKTTSSVKPSTCASPQSSC